jgi:retron-type reverse transcriptase
MKMTELTRGDLSTCWEKSYSRYADDCNIYVARQRAGECVMVSVKEFLEKRLRLKINESKSAVDPSKISQIF